MADERRGELWPLIIRSMGTADTRENEADRQVLSVRLAAWCARQVLHLAPDQDAALAAIQAAEAWAGCPCRTHAAAANIAAYAAAANIAAYAAYAAAAAAYTAAAYAAYAAAYAAAAATYATDLVALLTGLIDHHAELTGHTPVTVTDDEVRMLAEAVRA